MTTPVNTISGIFAYAKVQEPSLKYQSETEKEFSIDVIVDKATAKAFGKQFPKQKGKVVDTSDFKEIYKIDPPFPDQDEQYILKLKKPAQFNDKATGNMKAIPEIYWPKIVVKKNGKAVPLARDILIANGSMGKVSYEVNENSYGIFAKLKNILVEELIEYKKADASGADDFGLELDTETAEFDSADDGNGGKVKVPASAKTAPKKIVKQDDDFDNQSPF